MAHKYQTSPKVFQNGQFLANCDEFALNDTKMCGTRPKKSYRSIKSIYERIFTVEKYYLLIIVSLLRYEPNILRAYLIGNKL